MKIKTVKGLEVSLQFNKPQAIMKSEMYKLRFKERNAYILRNQCYTVFEKKILMLTKAALIWSKVIKIFLQYYQNNNFNVYFENSLFMN